MAALATLEAARARLPLPEPANDPVSAPAARTLLRFITCGSVDDGKSTLIGRMLHDAGAIPDDQLVALEKDSRRFGTTAERPDLALLVDGLQAEREQGITIDVAYRYFSTPRRSFIVADTPGHEQYTRNMATGASTADLAIILIDARSGLLPQTRRHSFITALVGVRQVVVAVNKMDLVGFDEATFRRIEADYRAAVRGLGFEGITCIPLSALDGDNVATRSGRMPWYRGPALLPLLETIEAGRQGEAAGGLVFPVQWVNRPDEGFRGYAGTLASGTVRPGETVTVLPSGRTSRIARIVSFDGDKAEAQAGEAVTLTVEDAIDIARGDVLVAGRPAGVAARGRLEARLLVTADRSVRPGDGFLIKIGTAIAAAQVETIRHAVEIESFAAQPAAALAMNGIGLATLVLDRPLVTSPYGANRDLGGFILIDRLSSETVAMGFVADGAQEADAAPAGTVAASPPLLQRLFGQPGSARRQASLRGLSWRLLSGALVGLGVLALGGGTGLAAAAAILDPLLRTGLRFVHDLAWRRFADGSATADTLESGSGI